MADQESRGDWIVDCLVGFLQSPVWKFQVDTFLEEECIVFDEGGDNDPVYRHVHTRYRTVVDKLMDVFVSELGVSAEQLTETCAKSKGLKAEHERLFQHLLASGDYELFKSIMTQKNVDLELQALELLQKQLGQSIGAYDSHAPSAPPPQQILTKQEAEEEEALQNALELSKKESEMQLMAEDQEMEKLMELAIQESLKMHRQESLKEGHNETSEQDKPSAEENQAEKKQETGSRVQQETVSRTQQETGSKMQHVSSVRDTEVAKDDGSSPRRLDVIPPLGGTALKRQEVSQAAQMWIQSAKSEQENRQSESPVIKQHKPKGIPEELKARERYLKSQRDRLLEAKRKERAEALKRYTETTTSTAPMGSRPPSRNPTPSQPRTDDARQARGDTEEARRASQESVGNKLTAKSSSGVLCSVIAKKLKEEYTY